MDPPSSGSSSLWTDVANTTTANTTASQSPPEDSLEEFPLRLRFDGIDCSLSVPDRDFPILDNQRTAFLESLGLENGLERRRPQSPATLGLQFIQFLFENCISRETIKSVLWSFRRQFLFFTDIHTIITESPDSISSKKEALSTYYSAKSLSSLSREPVESALFSAAEKGSANVYGVFGGQGLNNPKCLSELRDFNFQFKSLLTDLIDAVDPLLKRLSRLPQTKGYYQPYHIDINAWLEDTKTIPDQNILAAAAFSFPIIGLNSLAHFCATCKILNKSPGELRSNLRGITGHSQGIVIAAAVADSDSWSSFYKNAKAAIEILFWIGFECENGAPRSSLSASSIADSLEKGEGRPTSMLSVRNLPKSQVQAVIEKCNECLDSEEKVSIGLTNGQDNFVIAGPAKTLHALSLYLREIEADPTQDQSRIRFSKRKPVIDHQFLPINAPFHSSHLEKATKKIMHHIKGQIFNKSEKPTPVFHTTDGRDISNYEGRDAVEVLVSAITLESVDWLAASKFLNGSHIIAFDADVGPLMSKNKDGQGVRVIMASEIETNIKGVGPQAELFTKHLPAAVQKPISWGDEYLPRIAKLDGSKWLMDTKLSRLLGTPPVMVAGMTPTTVPWDFVSAIMNAGYHAELAGGGYLDATSMSKAIRKLAENVPVGRGITCNLIYVSPKAMAWQIPMIGQLIREGVPVDGLTIGAGVPSIEIATDYILSLGLKHLSLKPGSLSAIKQVISIAEAHHSFPIILQWTGGRGGGHHSFEDFHEPLLQTYSEIRRHSNIILVVGSGFGGADDTFPYFTGTWAHQFGRCLMPVDGVLLGSRMMVAKEAHTSPQAKELIVESSGSTNWEKSYDGEIGGVMTVQSEMGQPIHKIATRGVRLWSEMDKKIFKLPKDKRVAELQKNKAWIQKRLAEDFAKPWFGMSTSGTLIEVPEMTCGEILSRLVELMYVSHQKRWIDESYLDLFFDVAWRIAERLSLEEDITFSKLRDPEKFLASFFATFPNAQSVQVHPEDAYFFIKRCKERNQKPVNFVPALDEDFEFWFKKDSLWQSEDVEAVVDQDAGRVCILQGPVSAQYSVRQDESAKDILDKITSQHLTMMRNLASRKCDLSVELNKTLRKRLVSDLEESSLFQELHCPSLSLDDPDWIDTLLREEYVYQGSTRINNPIRQLMQTRCRTAMHNETDHSELQLINGFNGRGRTLARIQCFKNSNISIDIFHPGSGDDMDSMISFQYIYRTSGCHHCLCEIMEQRNEKIKSYYTKIWLGTHPTRDDRLSSAFDSEVVTLTEEMLRSIVSTVGKAYTNGEMTKSSSSTFPIDCCIFIAWEVVVRPLLAKDFDVDLLKLVHRANTFEYAPGVSPLHVGERVSASSSVQSVTIEPAGKAMTVRATILRSGEVVATVTSTFLCRGRFPDFHSTFTHRDEPEMKLLVENSQDEAILLDREWFHLYQTSQSLIGKSLLFQLRTRIATKKDGGANKFQTSGTIFEIHPDGSKEKIGDVKFAAQDSEQNPVTDYLKRKGKPTADQIGLKVSGWNGQSKLDVTMPSCNEEYARLSGDYNPIHVSQVFADWAGLPGPISHGMLTSAVARGAIEHLIGDERRTRFQKWSTSFVGMVLPGDKLTVSFQHYAMIQGRMILQVSVHKSDSDEKVLEGEAEVEQEETAYVFTGQGSQSMGMGMDLYNSSDVARKIWDEADRVLEDAYGWSIKDIVRRNPKTITVRFGGNRGRQIRENYLKMRIDDTLPDGTVMSVPLLKTLNDHSESYTFSDPQGLIFSTQFAQPAIILAEKASFEDMRSKGVIQEKGLYAGHSLGEYGSLSALADFIPVEALMKLLFYRGLAMQVAMERDKEGRTEYSMVAVNPTRVGKFFDETALRNVTKLVMQESRTLLEIVNFNIEGEQYVCAGHLRAISTLGSLLNHLTTTPSASEIIVSPNKLRNLVKEYVDASANIPMPIELQRGKATIPLKGIDVPFHSSHLQRSVPAYRKFLEEQISRENLQVDKLSMRYVPNLIGKRFSTDMEFLKGARDLTGSEVLKELVEPVGG